MSESRAALRRLRARRNAHGSRTDGAAGERPLQLGADVPGCTYGAVTRRAVDDVTRAVERIEVKLNTLLLGALVSILLEVWRTAHR